MNPTAPAWPDVLASALVGTARRGGSPEVLLEVAAAHALRRRAGVAMVPAARPPAPVPDDDGTATVGPEAAVRIGDLLALDTSREAGPVRDTEGRVELLTEWLSACAVAGRRLPAELAPALLDAGRRHRAVRPWVAPVAGPLAGWLAAQRPEWSYAAATPPPSDVEDSRAWEYGALRQRVAYLARLRRAEPARALALLRGAWDTEAPDDRAELLKALVLGLSTQDEPLLERALDDRRRQVRDVALDLLARLPDAAHARRMAARALACVVVSGGHVHVRPPEECDRSMRRDGVSPRPPAGTGERAWWLEEILARAPLRIWPEPRALLSADVSEGWAGTLRRGLARAAALQHDGAWARALADLVTADVTQHGRPEDRLLLEALYDALPVDELATRAAAALRRGLAGATALGVDHMLALCPRPWPPAVADAVFAALEDQLGHRGGGWRMAALCELAALRLPAGNASRAAALVELLHSVAPVIPGLPAVERFAATLSYRHDMLEELA